MAVLETLKYNWDDIRIAGNLGDDLAEKVAWTYMHKLVEFFCLFFHVFSGQSLDPGTCFFDLC